MKRDNAVGLLRSAAVLLKKDGPDDLIIPEHDHDKYPMKLKPGTYKKAEVCEAIQFLADMLEE